VELKLPKSAQPACECFATPLISAFRFTFADDLPAAGTMVEVVLLSKAHAAIFILRFNLCRGPKPFPRQGQNVSPMQGQNDSPTGAIMFPPVGPK